MFFDDSELALKRNSRLRVPPPVPATGWRPPTYFPNLTDASVLAFDVETREDDFDKGGPGWSRGKSSIIGFSIAARKGADTGKWYYPVRHEVGIEWNLNPHNCFGWLREMMATNIPKVGANLLYDIGTLGEENIHVNGKLHDVQFAEALLDEEGDVNLEWLSRKYLGLSKTSSILYDWLSKAYGGKANGAQRGNIYRAPPELVGPYGEDDADLPLQILTKQWPLLVGEGLVPLFELENRLIPLLIKMRRRGVSIDIPYVEQLHDELTGDLVRMHSELFELCGIHAEVDKAADLIKVFNAVGIKVPTTKEGAPTFTKDIMKAIKHPVTDKINEIREVKKIKSTFVKGALLDRNVNGVVHTQFHPLRGDDDGTKTGRFASSTPNLQNIPVRTKLGKRVRRAFVARKGLLRWRKFDYSQIEYRMLAHFAVDGKDFDFQRVQQFWAGAMQLWGYDGFADKLRQAYQANPKTDYHQQVMVAFALQKGIDLASMSEDAISDFRKPIKNVNFGLLYGQTEKALAHKSGLTPAQAVEFFKTYHSTAAYVKPTMAAITQEVHNKGYVTTILGRRTRFRQWQPAGYGERGMPLGYAQALGEYGHNIKRAYAYRGTNYKFQGSAADVIKQAMDAAYTSGVFDVIGYPLLQVHDELDFEEIDESPAQVEAYRYLEHVLENSIKLRVPVKVDSSYGATWADAK